MSLDQIPFCDIFHPTFDEFNNFENYIEKITKISKSGIVKIIPPKGWKARADNYKNLDFIVPRPIEQIISGKGGIYELINLQRESRILTKYKKLVEVHDKYFTKNIEEMEKKFSFPLYGADAPGSLFDKNVKWNLHELQSVLKEGLDQDINGVTTPYLYIGSWKAMFAWHKEDLDLCSINYLHFGKPKFWYGIDPSDENKFNDFVNKLFPESKKECEEFMRHKTFMVYPGIVKSKGIKIHKCIQNPGEFVVTLGKCYHTGFNTGYNCAEAVNFATKSWLTYGHKAKSCKCDNDSVKMDMKNFMKNMVERKKQNSKKNKIDVNNSIKLRNKKKIKEKKETNFLNKKTKRDEEKNYNTRSVKRKTL